MGPFRTAGTTGIPGKEFLRRFRVSDSFLGCRVLARV